METPQSRAAYFIDVISEQSLFEAQAELEVDPSVETRVAFFVSIIGLSPYRPFAQQLSERPREASAEAEELRQAVISRLQDGDATDAADRKLRRAQHWAWGAVVTDLLSLLHELESRYEHGDCETEIHWKRLPGGLLIECRILPRFGEAVTPPNVPHRPE